MKKLLAILFAGFLGALVLAAPATATTPTPTPSATKTAEKTQKVGKDCEAYRYDGTNQNLCDRFPNRSDVNCPEVKWRVRLVDNSKDPWDLDGLAGGDRGVVGLGCESNPKRPAPTKTPVTKKPTPKTPKPSKTTEPPTAGPTLPKTPLAGGQLVPIVAGGFLAVALGAVGVVVFRRRRYRYEA